MVREKSDYLTFGDICAGYQYDGFVYHLFRKNGDEYEANDMNYTPKKNVGKDINNLGLHFLRHPVPQVLRSKGNGKAECMWPGGQTVGRLCSQQ